MTKENEKKEKIKLDVNKLKKIRNIVIIAAVVILVGSIGIYKLHQKKETEKFKTSYLLKSGTVNLEIKNLSEVDQILSETAKDYFVFITYNDNKDTYSLEEGLKDIIDKYKLGDKFYYLNATELMNDDNFIANLNTTFKTDKITKIPTILYFSDKKLVDYVHRADGNCIKAGDFQKLIDIYEIEG